jgi:proline iminopeptidase
VRDRYPQLEPYGSGLLDVGAGDEVFWEVSGNPDGTPAVVLHGGPGSGSSPATRRLFDPQRYRIVQLDQRNCSRSRPHASEPTTSLAANTTGHLVADLELLREHLDIERWVVWGASFGSVLGLAYAQRHPERVRALVLAGVATGRRRETDLLTRGVGQLFPLAWERFRAGVPAYARDGDLAAAYARLLEDEDPVVRAEAARDWCAWEDAMLPTSPPDPRYDDPRFRLAFARLVTHYWSRGHFLDEGEILEGAGRLAGIPGVIVQGALDLGNLLGTAWELAARWPGAELVVVDDTGHGGGARQTAAVVTALDRFA